MAPIHSPILALANLFVDDIFVDHALARKVHGGSSTRNDAAIAVAICGVGLDDPTVLAVKGLGVVACKVAVAAAGVVVEGPIGEVVVGVEGFFVGEWGRITGHTANRHHSESIRGPKPICRITLYGTANQFGPLTPLSNTTFRLLLFLYTNTFVCFFHTLHYLQKQ